MSPQISIIVPVYNVEKYLSRCLDSILYQTFSDFEILLINDGSTDNSGGICDKYAKKDKRIRVFHKNNEGVSRARNTGLDNAKGDWITFVDSDDWIDKDMYYKLYNEAILSEADIIMCDFYIYYNQNSKDLIKSVSTESSKEDIIKNYILSFTSLCNILVHRSLYDNHRLRIPENFSVCEDFWLSVQLFYYAKKISSVHIPLYFYNRENINSILNNPNKTRYIDECKVYLDILSFFKNKNVLSLYQKEVSWRILKSKQDLVLNPSMHKEFLKLYPDSNKYILSCPDFLCNKKIKILMWLLVHKMSGLVVLFCQIRKFKSAF